MNNLFESITIESKLGSIKKFYFLDYFYIFLKSVSSYSEKEMVFDYFKNLKDMHKLSESRFKKLISADDEVSAIKLVRYKYTFNEVLEELLLYKLINVENDKITLTEKGHSILMVYQPNNPEEFYYSIFKLMEQELHGFYQMVKYCYQVNTNGLLIFPMYSPMKLDMRRSEIKTNGDMVAYIKKLAEKLQDDLIHFIFTPRDLTEPRKNIIKRLVETELLGENNNEAFNHQKYNVILKRVRDFWINYFLKEIYQIPLSLSFFDIWCYRGKQLGIINITEFYYNFDGRIVYPTSIISKKVINSDFKNIFDYKTGECLFLHEPNQVKLQESFSRVVYDSYIDLKIHSNSYFVNIADLRDVVCYKLKISNKTFQDLLETLYLLNIKGQTTIRISLEADRLPEETKAMYQKRDPIMIEGTFKNIIAIDLKK